MTTRAIVVITDDTTAEDIAKTITIQNEEAKALRRRGFIGVRGVEYAVRHDRINSLLDDWLAAAR